MLEIFQNILFFIIVLPFMIFSKGYDMLKKFAKKHGYEISFLHVLLVALIILLILLFLNGYR